MASSVGDSWGTPGGKLSQNCRTPTRGQRKAPAVSGRRSRVAISAQLDQALELIQTLAAALVATANRGLADALTVVIAGLVGIAAELGVAPVTRAQGADTVALDIGNRAADSAARVNICGQYEP